MDHGPHRRRGPRGVPGSRRRRAARGHPVRRRRPPRALARADPGRARGRGRGRPDPHRRRWLHHCRRRARQPGRHARRA
nr:hypothetical protein [Cellulomonas timonensis]